MIVHKVLLIVLNWISIFFFFDVMETIEQYLCSLKSDLDLTH